MPRKAVVIGLDAADFAFLDPWMEAGDLPRLKALRGEGASGVLASTFPPVSAPAWSTFMTGLRPERHGLIDFVMEDPANGRKTMARSDLIRGRKLWEAVGDAGRRSVVVNVPITWPPSEFPGLLVTGMLTPEGKTFTHPADLGARLLQEFPGYRTDFDVNLISDVEALRKHLLGLADQASRLMRTLMKREAWDLYVGVFTTTDRVKHQCWDRRETIVREHYRAIDRYVGELIDDAGPDALVLVLSDHGFRSVESKFYPNRWLKEQGLLATRTVRPGAGHGAGEADEQVRAVEEMLAPVKREDGLIPRIQGMLGMGGDLAVDPARTKAYLYSIETGGIHVNLEGRAPGGIVEPGKEYEEVRDRVIAGLRALKSPGSEEPLFDLVDRREAVYRGPMVGWCPDVVTRSKGNRVTMFKDLDAGKWLRGNRHDRGGHSPNGILLARGPGVRKGARVDGLGIEDVMPTLLWWMGIPVASDLDGRVRTDLFEDEVVRSNPIVKGPASAPDARPAGDAFSADEEEELRKTLEGLGYV